MGRDIFWYISLRCKGIIIGRLCWTDIGCHGKSIGLGFIISGGVKKGVYTRLFILGKGARWCGRFHSLRIFCIKPKTRLGGIGFCIFTFHMWLTRFYIATFIPCVISLCEEVLILEYYQSFGPIDVH